MSSVRVLRRALLLTAIGMAVCVPLARAQAFLSPYYGYNFSGDAACVPSNPACLEHNPALGLAFGNINALIGFEEDFSYAKNIFKDASSENSSVVTLMSNVLVGPLISKVRPYGAGGFGLMRSRTKFKPQQLVELTNSDIGWNVGGGVMVTTQHIGIRGDIRFFHGLSNVSVLGFPVSNLALDFGRAVVGLVLQ